MTAPNTRDRRADLRYRWLELGEQLEQHRRDGLNRMVRRLERERDRIANDFAAENKGLAAVVAKQFFTADSRANHEDYLAAAWAGLWEAFLSWDPEQSTFGNFSRQYIAGATNRAFHAAESEGISYGDHSARPAIRETEQRLTEKLGRVPTDAEIAEDAGYTVSLVKRVRAARPVSLETPTGADGGTIADLIAAPAHVGSDITDAIRSAVVRNADHFEPFELFTLSRYYGIDGAEPQSFVELSAMIGTNRETARRRAKKAKAVLEDELAELVATHGNDVLVLAD